MVATLPVASSRWFIVQPGHDEESVRLYEVTIIAATAKTVVTVVNKAAGYRKRHDRLVFEKIFSQTPEDALRKFRQKTTDKISRMEEEIGILRHLLTAEPTTNE